ncbi:MAG: DNA repair protein [Lachnospiraceae bacterium]|nr:DNA repair protein [Lachnospiraceae bacterium]
MEGERIYCCIDLKSFYASVECHARGLDPITTNLVVADVTRTEGTICLAVSPAMKKLGVPGRCRLFEIPKNIEYLVAPPRMALYVEVSAQIYGVYLRYIAKEDIHVYSIDEVFIDLTDYLALYKTDARTLCEKLMRAVYEETGVRATAGIGTNLYLAKIAMDITAKKMAVAAGGVGPVPIGELTEESYRRTLWDHEPLTDFWRIGRRTQARLARYGVTNMRGIAQTDPEIWFREFGIDAELLIDHAWGRESTRMQDIKAYRSKSNSLSSAQVIGTDADFEGAKLILKGMTEELALSLLEEGLMTERLDLFVAYDRRLMEGTAHGSARFERTDSAERLRRAAVEIFEREVDPDAMIRYIGLSLGNVGPAGDVQLSLFSDPEDEEKEKRMQEAVLKVRGRYGKNALLRGMDLQEGATRRERNEQIGGHRRGDK